MESTFREEISTRLEISRESFAPTKVCRFVERGRLREPGQLTQVGCVRWERVKAARIKRAQQPGEQSTSVQPQGMSVGGENNAQDSDGGADAMQGDEAASQGRQSREDGDSSSLCAEDDDGDDNFEEDGEGAGSLQDRENAFQSQIQDSLAKEGWFDTHPSALST